jgi:hypothetical protein
VSQSDFPTDRAYVVRVMRTFHDCGQSRRFQPYWVAVCTKNHIRIGNVMESPKLAE